MLGGHSPDCPVCSVGVLCPDGCIDQNATWCEGRPRPMRHCVRWRPSSPYGMGHSSLHFSGHVYCQTVAHLSNCWTPAITCHWRQCRHWLFVFIIQRVTLWSNSLTPWKIVYRQCLIVLNRFRYVACIWTSAELNFTPRRSSGAVDCGSVDCTVTWHADQTRHMTDGSVDNLLTITDSYILACTYIWASPRLNSSTAAHVAAAADAKCCAIAS